MRHAALSPTCGDVGALVWACPLLFPFLSLAWMLECSLSMFMRAVKLVLSASILSAKRKGHRAVPACGGSLVEV
eukprot:1155043-Pelagomonas_calceolata.AAC.5